MTVGTKIPDSVVALSHMPMAAVRLRANSSEIHEEALHGQVDGRVDNLQIDIMTGGGRAVEPNPLLVSNIALTIRMMMGQVKIATLKGEWQLAFAAQSLDALQAIDDDLAVAFNTFVAPKMLWSFAREFFVNLSWRMQLPPAILPPFDPAMFPDFLKAGAEAALRHDAKQGSTEK